MKKIMEATNSSINDSLVMRIFRGVLTSMLVTLIFLFLLSVILTYSNMSETIIPISIVMISAISILIGSLLTTKKMKKNGIINGGMIGFIYIVLLYLISSIVSQGFCINAYSIAMMIFSILAGMFGGILGVNLNQI